MIVAGLVVIVGLIAAIIHSQEQEATRQRHIEKEKRERAEKIEKEKKEQAEKVEKDIEEELPSTVSHQAKSTCSIYSFYALSPLKKI